jgi:hypothetical protein
MSPPDCPDLVRVPWPHCGGRRTRPERIVREYEEQPEADGLIGHDPRITTPEILAAFGRILYRGARVGMSLEFFARRPASS